MSLTTGKFYQMTNTSNVGEGEFVRLNQIRGGTKNRVYEFHIWLWNEDEQPEETDAMFTLKPDTIRRKFERGEITQIDPFGAAESANQPESWGTW